MPALRKFVQALRETNNPRGSNVRRPESALNDEARLLKAKADKAEFDLEREKREWVKRSTVESRMVQAIRAICAEHDAMAESLPGELRTTDAALWSQLLRDRFGEMRERFAANADVEGAADADDESADS